MLNIGKKKYRNLQEQVGYNTKEIEKLFSILDGIDYEDHVVVIQDISIPLTEEEMLIVLEPVSFLVYEDKLYFKDHSDTDKLYFSAVMKINETDVITITSQGISVSLLTGQLEILEDTSTVYSTEETDNKIMDLENAIESVASGSPAGTYSTYDALVSADPNHDRIYVVVETGNWYYWNGTAWTSGGTYLADSNYNDLSSKIELEITNDVEITEGYFRDNYGTITAGSSYSMVRKLPLYPSQGVKVVGYGYSNIVAIISQVDENGTFVRVLVVSNEYGTYEYTNETDEIIYVDLSFANSRDYFIYQYSIAYAFPKAIWDLKDESYDYLGDNFVAKNGVDQLKVQNAEFLDTVVVNAFDGEYIDGWSISDEGSYYQLNTRVGRYNLGICKIKPNTKYTLVAYNQGNNMSLIRCATNSTRVLTNLAHLDGSMKITRTNQTMFVYTFTSGENDNYVYLYGPNNTSNARTHFWQVCEGEISTLTATKYNEYYGIPNDKLHIQVPDADKVHITIQKVSDTSFNVIVPPNGVGKSIRYVFNYIYKKWDSLTYLDGNGQTQTAINVVSADYWNNYYVYDQGGSYVAQGNSNFIAKENGGIAHIGNGHGNEVALFTCFLADGAEIDLSQMSNGDTIECSNFKIIQRTKTYRCGGDVGGSNNFSTTYPALDTSGNPITVYNHNMEMTFEIGNEITIHNQLVFKQNNVQFEQLHGAMLECNFGDFTDVICNNEEWTRNIVSSNGIVTVPDDSTIDLRSGDNVYQKCNKVEMFGEGFYIMQEMLQDDISKNDKSNVYFNFNPDRLKCYFQPAITGLKKSSWGPMDTFNIGDQISVTNHRKIVVKED